jgi:uncharacterized protein (DUF169 family)
MTSPEAARFIADELRLRTAPIGVKFLSADDSFPEKTRIPSKHLGKRITICQGVTMARVYQWTVGLSKQDLVCVPAMIAFGFVTGDDRFERLAELFRTVSFHPDDKTARQEVASMSCAGKDDFESMVLAPLERGLFEPDTVVLYGSPAQIMRLIQAWDYHVGERVPGNFGGKVECSEYLSAPFKSGKPNVVIPGQGDRIFSMTQDDEMVFALPGKELIKLTQGLKVAGKKIGARYPITFYQNFQPEFPEPYQALGKELGAF